MGILNRLQSTNIFYCSSIRSRPCGGACRPANHPTREIQSSLTSFICAMRSLLCVLDDAREGATADPNPNPSPPGEASWVPHSPVLDKVGVPNPLRPLPNQLVPKARPLPSACPVLAGLPTEKASSPVSQLCAISRPKIPPSRLTWPSREFNQAFHSVTTRECKSDCCFKA